MRAVAVNLAAVFPDIPAQLLALLGRQTAMLPTPPTLPITPALDVRISPQFALLPKITLLLPVLETARRIPAGRLGLSRQTRSHSQKSTRAPCQDVHFFILSSRGRSLVDGLIASGTLLRVMLFLINMLARQVLVLPQVLTLVARQYAIRLVLAFLHADRFLFTAQIFRFLPSQAAVAHATTDAIVLIVLACIYARVARRPILPALTLLFIVLLIVNVPAGPILITMQIGPLGTGQMSIRQIAALFLADATLLALKMAGLATCQITGADSLAYALLLMILLRIDSGIEWACMGGCGQPKRAHSGQKHADEQGFHFVLLKVVEDPILDANAFRRWKHPRRRL